jgi:hypothetical protein
MVTWHNWSAAHVKLSAAGATWETSLRSSVAKHGFLEQQMRRGEIVKKMRKKRYIWRRWWHLNIA